MTLLHRFGIRAQFLLLLLAVALGVASVTAGIAARAQRESMLEERKLRGLAVLRAWSSLSRERLLSDESVNLSMWDFIDVLMHGEQSVVEVYLLDTSGAYLMHNRQALVGTSLPREDLGKKTAQAGSGIVVRSDTAGQNLWFLQSVEVNGRRLGTAGVVFSSAGIESEIRDSMRRIFLSAALIALLGVASASLLVYHVTRPLGLLTQGVRRFGERFDPERPETADVRIDFGAINELGELRDAFNEMTQALRRTTSERKALKEESGFLRMQAKTDALTGLYNKRQFEEDFPELVGISQRRNRPLCLLMMDMDRFKLLNDTLGHAAGDRALKDLAQSIRERTRSTERAYRLGGDEFMVLSVGTGLEEAKVIAERICEDYQSRKEDGNPTSVSVGIVGWDGFSSPEELLQEADREMYRVKRERKAQR